jgi:transcriptional regulator with XRE-family HTH domain
MPKDYRRAKVTPETKEEARQLAELWASRSHPSQAEFGETYGIGNQSAVGQFLRGGVPLSLKAARGFAQGLGCKIEDFSPRLAAEAAAIANMVPGEHLRPEVADVAAAINSLPKAQRDWVLTTVRNAIELARETLAGVVQQHASEGSDVELSQSPKRSMG